MGSKSSQRALWAALLLCLTLALHISAIRAEEQLPPELKNIGINPTLGTTIPLNPTFTDESGRQVSLSSFFNKGKPVILTPVYYECPMLCNLILNGLTDGLKGLTWTPGDQFEVVTVSFNPLEKPELAKAKKASYLNAYGRPQAASGWHFLTSTEAQIKPLTDAIGFKYAWDPAAKQYAHAAGIFVLTSSGKLSQALYGIEYPSRDLRLALTEAAEGKIGTVVDKLLLFCFHYDPQKKGYSLAAFRVVQLAGSLTVVLLGGSIGSMLLWERRRRRKQAATPQAAPPEVQAPKDEATREP